MKLVRGFVSPRLEAAIVVDKIESMWVLETCGGRLCMMVTAGGQSYSVEDAADIEALLTRFGSSSHLSAVVEGAGTAWGTRVDLAGIPVYATTLPDSETAEAAQAAFDAWALTVRVRG